MLNETALGSQVTSALGLTQIGTLTTLSVDNITLNDYAIPNIRWWIADPSDGTITIANNPKITGLANPNY